MAQEEKTFAEGFVVRRQEDAPDFVMGRLGINITDAIPFLQRHADERGWVNIDLLFAKGTGKPYAVLNTYKPKGENNNAEKAPQKPDVSNPDQEDDDLPF